MSKNISLKTVVIYLATATGIMTINHPVIAIAPGSPEKLLVNFLASADTDYNFLATSDWYNCQQLGTEYKEVYAFETTSFYINICQKDNVYFYSGEAKESNQNSIFIPAYPLKNQRGFRAANGNLSYLVLLPFEQPSNLPVSNLKPAEAILTIKRNGQLIAVESSLNKYCDRSETTITFDNLGLQSSNSLQIATVNQPQDTSWDLFSLKFNQPLPTEIFQSNSQFDFYRIGGELRRLTTCEQVNK